MAKHPRTIIIRNTEPEHLWMAIYVVVVGLNGKEKLPILFDCEPDDRKKRTDKIISSFLIYETKQGLVIKRVNAKERKKYLDRVQN